MASFHTTRTRTGRGPLGCLIPMIASTVLLAAGVTLISWFALGDADLEPTPPASIAQPHAPSAHAGRTPSIPAILEVIKSDGFVEFGVPESIDLGSQRQISYKFLRDAQEIHLTIYSYASSREAQQKVAETREHTFALRMGHRVIALTTPSKDPQALLLPVGQKLETYQRILDAE